MDFGWPNVEIGWKNGQWPTVISSTAVLAFILQVE